VAPVFVAMTDQADRRARRRVALRASTVALVILLTFAVGGAFIFDLFGITISSLRIAGGILFFAMSMRLLNGRPEEMDAGAVPPTSDPSVVPLGMPLICGPGAISTVMVLVGQSTSMLHTVMFFLALFACLGITALVLLASPRIVGFVGQTGIDILTRVIGLITCAIGIQFVIDGVRPIAVEILGSS
jgi:multiple antibiotic resistance protein